MKFDFETGEVILVNKPLTWTSFDVVNRIRISIKESLGIKKIKIGHAGTLDPLADGLLILCTGRFTKKIDEYQAQEKEYTGTFRLGATTPSYDLEHEIDAEFSYTHITPESILASVATLSGEVQQTPPVYSAIKVNGRRAYKYARKDKELKLEPRNITISEFEISSINLPDVDFRIVCSKGTYIRALARDFGLSLNSGAHLTALRRTRIGKFHLSQAWDLESLLKEITIMKEV